MITPSRTLIFDKLLTNDKNRYNITGYERNGPYRHERVRGSLSRMPGSPTIWISHGLKVSEAHRGNGYSKQYNSVMITLAFQTLDASAIICSVKNENVIQTMRLAKLGWEHISKALWMIKPSDISNEKSSETWTPDGSHWHKCFTSH
jgi:hypothetical protein